MKLLNRLSSLIFLISIFFSASTFAETSWEVGIVFLENNEDVAQNLNEIKSISLSENLSISIFNNDLKHLPQFLRNAFTKLHTKKSLIIYSHGQGPKGLQDITSKELKEIISSNTPHLDILWFDSCYMGNVEFLYEIRKLSTYTIASEDAEFSSGLPFQVIEQLPASNTVEEAALMLAKNFIESYSYIKNGSQRNYVSVSSATISVFENKNWDLLTYYLKLISSKIKGIKLNVTYLKNKYAMEDGELIDLGNLLIELRAENKDAELDKNLTNAIRLLNIQSVKKLKTNPRIKISNPQNESLMVFGFNNWGLGSQVDYDSYESLKRIVKNDGFISGPRKNKWPYKKQKYKTIMLLPFAPGVNTFNYYFLSKDASRLLSESKAFYRVKDFVEINRDNSNSPMLYTAYTQEVGKNAERYTGLSITFPGTIPTLDYFELEFNGYTNWLKL